MTTPWLRKQWAAMLRIRLAEEAVAAMVESGEARCPCHLYIGQEAVAVGVCAALEAEDTIWGGHRSHGHYLAKGGSLEAMFAEILGRAGGCSSGRGGSMHLRSRENGILGTVPIVAATVPLAAGAAMANKLRGEPRVAVSFLGDGTIEEGLVQETLNLAALYRLPVVFICENNLYASHMHWSERRVLDNLDRAGDFHGVPGERVDGNDVAKVYRAAARAIARARDEQGPSWIECRTFRWRGHVGASFDMDVGVRRRPELVEWLERDPVRRAERELRARGTTTDVYDHATEIEREVNDALDSARRQPPRPADATSSVYQESVCAR
ncbi:MAG TPA: thiamine pyrophosphate-dependent dehydrogenase E1 component subunit alpha [Bryobacteraceae bacterium]|nr:thiamine pyrophosphate-dependent dehydrogenase E1 component subunit alpha [Bryobacteraceae bacterium]